MDNQSKKQRSINMSHIKGKNTSLELKVRKRLFHDGFRYRINVSTLPGKPDIVLPKYSTAIFINGCFWHRHGCKLSTTPKSNQEYWNKKFKKNVENDIKNQNMLRNLGWHVIIIWECEIKENFELLILSIENELEDILILETEE